MREVYTDGSCEKNPGGRGGWGWVEHETSYDFGHSPSTTNQRMEIQAALEALRAIPGDIHIFTDSQYMLNCALGKWKRKANVDLWDEFLPLMEGRTVEFTWVKGHSGVLLNEVADRLAYVGMTGKSEALSGEVPPATWSIPAHRNDLCPKCREYWSVGDPISKTPAGSWLHFGCF